MQKGRVRPAFFFPRAAVCPGTFESVALTDEGQAFGLEWYCPDAGELRSAAKRARRTMSVDPSRIPVQPS
jgi:hypothetical protein